jgi:hypothetical protein
MICPQVPFADGEPIARVVDGVVTLGIFGHAEALTNANLDYEHPFHLMLGAEGKWLRVVHVGIDHLNLFRAATSEEWAFLSAQLGLVTEVITRHRWAFDNFVIPFLDAAA